MRKSTINDLITEYDRDCWSRGEAEHQYIGFLKTFMKQESIVLLEDSKDIPFYQFTKYLMDNHPNALLTEEYLKSSDKSAILLRKFIEENPQAELKCKPGKADHFRQFSQTIFIERVAKQIEKENPPKRGLRENFFSAKKANLEKEIRGLCAGLKTKWYEFILLGKDLLTELQQEPIDLNLFQNIHISHRAHRKGRLEFTPDASMKLGFVDANYNWNKKGKAFDKQAKHKMEFSSEYVTMADADHATLTHFNFDHAESLPLMRIDQYEAHLDHLQRKNLANAEYGLHDIMLLDPKTHKGHIISWTYADNQYIIFDANDGETRFNHFDDFKTNVLRLLPFYDFNFEKSALDCFLSTTDYYHSPERIHEINEARKAKPSNKP